MIRPLFSQAGQDLWIMRDVFGWMENGYFLDIGAAEGVKLSNTYALEKYLGWSGICVEGYSKSYVGLVKNRRCKTVRCFLAKKSGKVRFEERGTFLGGLIEENEKAPLSGKQFFEVNAITLEELIHHESVPETIDYLSLDVEGAEDDIMSTFPFQSHRFLAATIERPGALLRSSLVDNGYILVAELPNLDAFYIHRQLADSYRIRAMEAAQIRCWTPWKRILHRLGTFKTIGIRNSLRRL
jgi:FkbM family methyltransferase